MAIICNVPNREYISALRQCAKEHENENLFTGQIDTTALCNDTAKLLENDVIERSEYEELRLVNLDLAETNKGLLAEHEQLEKLRSKVNKAIEEIEERIKYSKLPTVNRYNTYSEGLGDCLDILKRNIGE